jgi:hypothetical protein
MARCASHFKPRDGDLDSLFAALAINSDLTQADDQRTLQAVEAADNPGPVPGCQSGKTAVAPDFAPPPGPAAFLFGEFANPASPVATTSTL